MRKYWLLAATVLAIGLVRAEPATPEDKAFFEKNISKLVQLERTPLKNEALAKVFAAQFYSVEVRLGDDAMTTLTVARQGDALSTIPAPSTTQDLPALKALLKPDFKIKTNTDAKAFEAALDVLYPIDDRFDKDAVKLKAIRHTGTSWTFVRGKFFDDLSGFVVKTDAAGAVTDVGSSLEIKK